MPSGTVTTQPGIEMPALSKVSEIVGSQLEIGRFSECSQPEQALLTERAPPGLACLETADRLIIRKVYYAFEESKLCEECCCCRNRSFVMRIKNNVGKEVMRMARPSRCCCGESVDISADPDNCTIEAPPGKEIGTVAMDRPCFLNRCNVKDANNRVILKIDNAVVCCGWSTIDFPVTTQSGKRIGGIKKRSGFTTETHFIVQ
ncbi:Scramblase, partial [Ostertagia ostertagi]